MAAVLAAGAVAAGIVLGGGGGGGGKSAAPRLAIAPKTLGVIDATSHAVVARLPFASQPWDVAFDARQAWVLLGDQRRVARVDLASRRCSRRRGCRSARRHRDGGGAAWITQDDGPGLVRIDGATGRIVRRFSVQLTRRTALEPDRDRLRSRIGVGRRGPETVRVDPASGLVMRRIPTPPRATSVVFADDAVWVASAEDGRVMKIDPAIDKVAASTLLHGTITDLTVGNGSVWVAIVPDNVVYRLSADDGSVLATFPSGPTPSALSAADGLWIANAKGDQIVRVDRTGQREIVPLSGPPWTTRYHAGLLWTSVGAPEPVAADTTGKDCGSRSGTTASALPTPP